MILLELKRYIRQHHEVSLDDIVNHFDLTDEAAKGLLDPLVRQGHIQRLPAASACQSGRCSSGCASSKKSDHYLWRDKCLVSLPIRVQVL